MSWTDERVEILKKLWTEGRTAAEIAKELGGVTRNAVIGKAHRLKLSNRASPIQKSKKSVKTADKKVEVKKAKVTHQRRKVEEFIPPSGGVKLTDLKEKMCRWPIGDPRDDDFRFCGCEAIPGLPYCLEHAKIAYQPATRKRILKSDEVAQMENGKQQDLEAQADALLKKAANN